MHHLYFARLKISRERQGVLLIVILMVIPIILMLLAGVMRSTMNSSSHAGAILKRNELRYMSESGIQIAYEIFGSNNYSGYSHDYYGKKYSHYSSEALVVQEDYGFTQDKDGWYRWSSEDNVFLSGGEGESIRFKVEPLTLDPRKTHAGVIADATFGAGATWRISCEVRAGSRRYYSILEGDTVAPGEYTVFDNGSNSDFSRTSFQNVEGKFHANGDFYLSPWKTVGFRNGLRNRMPLLDGINLIQVLADADGLPFYDPQQRASYGTMIENLRPTLAVALDRLKDIGADNIVKLFLPDPIQFAHEDLDPTLELQIVAASPTPTVHLGKDKTPSLTAGGDIIRRKDLWGRRAQEGSRVVIQGKRGEHIELEGPSNNADIDDPEAAFDSLNPKWHDAHGGAASRFGNNVADHAAGQKEMRLPPAESFLPSGYFEKQSDIALTEATEADDYDWLSKKTFYNQAEDREVTVYEVDMGLYKEKSYAEDGLLYASVPVRLVNAAEVPENFTLASSEPVYLQGDFNESRSPLGIEKDPVAASIMTTDRVWTLTEDFNDRSSYHFEGLLSNAQVSKMVDSQSTLTELLRGGFNFALDDDGVLEVNASIADGIANHDAEAWKEGPNSGVNSGLYNPQLQVIMAGLPKNILPGVQVPDVLYPTDEGYLQNMSLVKVRINGSRIHMRNSNMGDHNNPDLDKPGIAAYRKRSYYVPMLPGTDDDPGFSFQHNEKVVGTEGRLPKFFLRAGRRLQMKSGPSLSGLGG